MKNKNYISMLEKSVAVLLLSMSFSIRAFGQAAEAAQAAAAVSTVKPTTAEEMKQETCEAQKLKSIAECNQPSNGGWQAAAQIFAGVAGAAAGFMAMDSGASDDPSKAGQASQMCALAEVLNKLSSALNGGQNDTCMNAAQACEEVCNKEIKKHNEKSNEYLSMQPPQMGLAQAEKNRADQAKENKESCLKEVEKQAQKAQQQQQANQSPGQGMSQCQQALNGDKEGEEPVDCSKDKFKGHPSCTGMSTNPGNMIGSERDPFTVGSRDDQDFDLPLDENAGSGYKANGDGSGGSNGAGGGLGFFGGSGSGGGGESQKTGGAAGAGRGGVGSLYGGSEGGGSGGAWGSMAGDGKDGNGRLSKLANKKSDVKVPTQRKLAGHKLGSGEFGLSTDDIWTRVYLRTNTRCTKQLIECAANRSTNPYGKK